MTLSDRIAVMNEGQIEQIGPPEEIYRNPASPFVAEFIGDTNMLSGVATKTDDGSVIELDPGAGVTITTLTSTEGDVTVSVRPEDFYLNEGGTIQGTVVERYFQGDHTNYVIDPDADAIDDVTVVIQGRRTPAEPGESVGVSIDPDAPVVFA